MSEQPENKTKSHNSTKLFIFIITTSILFILVALSVLNLLNKELYEDVLPYGHVLLILMLGFQLIILLRFFGAIRLINDSAHSLSQGKLNISDILVDKTKGLETLTIAFNDMKSNLLGFIESTKSNVIILSDSIDNVSKSIDMSYKGNEQIASSMSIVALKAQEQLKLVKDTIDRIEEVSLRTSNITTNLASTEEFVETTLKMTIDGSAHLDKYNAQVEIISNNLTDTAKFITLLNDNLKEIDQVGSLIINITGQLHLLSLNSSVEAARVGESGKGFAIVAKEMNKLSFATRDSIDQINKLLSDIMDSNSKVGSSIDSCIDTYNTSKEIFSSVKDSFYTINKNASILNEDIKKVFDESRLINENTNGIKEKGIILFDASNEISSITQEVAAVTEEELAENIEINNQALSLKNMLSSIEHLLRRYKTAVVPVDKTSSKRFKIVMMSPLDHDFWRGVRQGVLYAQNELRTKNVDIEYLGYEHMNDEFYSTLRDKIKAGCDGIIAPGFISKTYVESANEKNIPIMAFNCDFEEGADRLSYFGPDVLSAGTLAGELAIKAVDGEGEVAIFIGDLQTSINKIRRDTIVAALSKKKKVKLVAEVEAAISDKEVYIKTKETLNNYPNLKAIIITSGGLSGAVDAILECNRVGKTKIVCFDIEQKTYELMKKGIIYGAVGQDPFGQGHDPIVSMYNYLVANIIPESISYTRTDVVDVRNANDLG